MNNYTKEDYNLFWLMVQRDPESPLHKIPRPANISERTWRAFLFTVIAVGHEHRRVLRTFPGPVSKLAEVPWDDPQIQLQFIEQKINSREK